MKSRPGTGRAPGSFCSTTSSSCRRRRLARPGWTGSGGSWRSRGLRIGFTIKCRPDEVDPDLFRQLKEAGLLRVYLGLESNCQWVLSRFGKGFGAAANRRAWRVLEALGLVADFRVLLFHPWSTVETVAGEIEALGGLLDLVPSCLSFREVEIYPGTRLARDLAIEGAGRRPGPAGLPLPDAGAEWLRRMQRRSEGRGPYRRLCDHLTLDWFSALLADRRLIPGGGPDRRAIRAAARAANEAALVVLSELLGAVARAARRGLSAGRELAERLSGEVAGLCAPASSRKRNVASVTPGSGDARSPRHRRETRALVPSPESNPLNPRPPPSRPLGDSAPPRETRPSSPPCATGLRLDTVAAPC